MSKINKEIEKLYLQEKMSVRQVAVTLNKPYSTIGKYIRDKGLVRDRNESLMLRTTDEYREKLRAKQLGESNTGVKLNEKTVLEIREEYKSKLELGLQKTVTQEYLAKKYGVKRPTISDIVLKRTWKHI